MVHGRYRIALTVPTRSNSHRGHPSGTRLPERVLLASVVGVTAQVRCGHVQRFSVRTRSSRQFIYYFKGQAEVRITISF